MTRACRLVCVPAGPHAHNICMSCGSAQQAVMAKQLGRPIGANQRRSAEWHALLSYLLCTCAGWVGLFDAEVRAGSTAYASMYITGRYSRSNPLTTRCCPEPPAAALQCPAPAVAKRQQWRRKQEGVCWLQPAAAAAVLQPEQSALLCLRLRERQDQEGPEVVCCVLVQHSCCGGGSN